MFYRKQNGRYKQRLSYSLDSRTAEFLLLFDHADNSEVCHNADNGLGLDSLEDIVIGIHG